jgi:hypothetical protein
MDTVVAESGVTLDTGLLSENIIVLAFEVANDLTKARSLSVVASPDHQDLPYLASLSIWSPKPGVSTMVREMRVPSSSNSNSAVPSVGVWVG